MRDSRTSANEQAESVYATLMLAHNAVLCSLPALSTCLIVAGATDCAELQKPSEVEERVDS